MKLEYTVTEQDYLQYNWYFLDHAEGHGALMRRGRFMAPVIWMAMAVGFYLVMLLIFEDHDAPWLVVVVAAVASLIWYLGYPWLYRSSNRKNLGRFVAGSYGREFLGPRCLELLDHAIRESGCGQVFEVEWSRLEKVAVDMAHFYLFVGSMTALIVPFSAFADEAGRGEFLRLIEDRRRAVAHKQAQAQGIAGTDAPAR